MTENLQMAADGLQLKDVRLYLGQSLLLHIDASVAAGEVVTFMGPSGCGKTSLLSFVAGFLPDNFRTNGEVCLNGERIDHMPAHLRQIGLLFQTPLLFPHLSVGDNLKVGLRPGQTSTRYKGENRQEIIEGALADVGLQGCANRDPATLSGGQQTRVALLRLLLSAPKALLLDEPFSSLDKQRRQEVREMVFGLARDHCLPTLLVTHDEEDASAAGGRVILLPTPATD